MVVFALGLAVRYLLMDNEDRIYDHVEHKQKLTSLDHKAPFTVGVTDQVEGSEQACSSQEKNKQGPSSALFLKNGSAKSMASKKITRPRSDFSCLPRIESVDEAFEKDSSGVDVRTKVSDRRRTVSEGDRANDCQMSDNNQHPEGLIRADSSPPAVHQERSLEECKLMLKQSVCCTLLFLYNVEYYFRE